MRGKSSRNGGESRVFGKCVLCKGAAIWLRSRLIMKRPALLALAGFLSFALPLAAAEKIQVLLIDG